MNETMKRLDILRGMIFHSTAIATVAAVGVLAAICTPVLAQQSVANPLTVVADWKAIGGPHGANVAVSPDGLLLAHFGEQYPPALYIKNLGTGEDKLILNGPDGPAAWASVGNLAFSPDGGRLIFEAGPPRQFTGRIYSLRTDGSDLMELASDVSFAPDLSDPTGKTHYDMGVDKPLYSPDGSKILVQVVTTNGNRDRDGRIDDSEDKTYVGLLSANGVKQNPERLVEGTPEFWSSDGTAIYYRALSNDRPTLYRMDLETKQSVAVASPDHFLKVPGEDAVFVQNVKGNSISGLRLDGTAVSPELAKTASSIPVKDSEGRFLRAIETGGPHQLLLLYNSGTMKTPGIPDQHAQLVNVQ